MKDERPFLHDLSNPLTTITMIVDTLLARQKKASTPDHALEVQLEKVMDLLGEIRVQIKDRREVLIRRGE